LAIFDAVSPAFARMSCEADGVWETVDFELPGRRGWLFIGVVSTTRSNLRCTKFVPESWEASLRAVGMHDEDVLCFYPMQVREQRFQN